MYVEILTNADQAKHVSKVCSDDKLKMRLDVTQAVQVKTHFITPTSIKPKPVFYYIKWDFKNNSSLFVYFSCTTVPHWV